MAAHVEKIKTSHNGTGHNVPDGTIDLFEEVGSTGLETWGGLIQAAYNSKLYWPAVYAEYNKIRRSTPEIVLVGKNYRNLGRRTEIIVESPTIEPTAGDLAAVEFIEEVLEDIEGGVTGLHAQWVSYTPFMGWYWQEEVLGIRRLDWVPPDHDDNWRSKFDDGRIGLRRLAHRDHSSFYRWIMDDHTGKMLGMEQLDMPNPIRELELSRALHLTYGDSNNPEGLTPLESVWRLQTLQYNFMLIYGIGAEHTAGHVKIAKEEGDLSPADKSEIKRMARSLLSARAGNFVAAPGGIDVSIMDIPFSAASDIFEMIKYLGILILQLYQSQAIAIATTSGLGSQSALSQAIELMLLDYNGMIAGFWQQFNDQIIPRLLRIPQNQIAGMTRNPVVRPLPIDKKIALESLAQFVSAVAPIMPLGDDDMIAIRRKSGFLSTDLPEDAVRPVDIKQEVEELVASLAAVFDPLGNDG